MALHSLTSSIAPRLVVLIRRTSEFLQFDALSDIGLTCKILCLVLPFRAIDLKILEFIKFVLIFPTHAYVCIKLLLRFFCVLFCFCHVSTFMSPDTLILFKTVHIIYKQNLIIINFEKAFLELSDMQVRRLIVFKYSQI